ncbi:MAG TPA: response regulator [Bryobacteraceae bacterium]|nr:response regulator [Bryobacteraceae bacterium]
MRTILVVDDEPMALKLVQSVLEKRGFQVLTSTSPTQAIRLFETERDRIELLISDIVMPEMDGTHLARVLVSKNPELPVLFMSGFVTENEVADTQAIAQFAFIRKPFRPATLVQAVQKMLTGADETA